MWNVAFSNRLCYERENIKNHLKLLQNIRNCRPVTNSHSPPKTPSHLQPEAKRFHNKVERFRKEKIAFENGKLLKKILYIDMHKSSFSPKAAVKTPSPVRLPRKNAFKELKRQRSDIIQRQNTYLVKRLATVQSVYSTSKWTNDYSRHTMYRDMISKNTARYIKNKFFLSPVGTEAGTIDRPTTVLVRKILTRRSQRLSGNFYSKLINHREKATDIEWKNSRFPFRSCLKPALYHFTREDCRRF